ncbi:MAG: hypothetical protein MI975_19920 [Cytophagales bacterium]|nr:hypothetical protein [Cytophagales bacterium]
MHNQLDTKNYVQRLQTIAYLNLGAPLIPFIYLYLESSVDELEEIIQAEYHAVTLIPIVILCLMIIYRGIRKHRSMLEKARLGKELKEKLILYRKANNYRFFTYGLSSILITIGFYLTNFQAFAALFGIMIVLFSINNPNTRKIVNDLKLKNSDKQIILNGLEIP